MFETREVLAAAYLGPNKGGSMLSHAVEVDSTGAELRVLCGRVMLASIADVHAGDPRAVPSCKVCARRLARAQEEERSR